uniref:28 kDa ribonucleoprotein, chloroplastic n=1 Tax=Talaromyces marneffei PM1 TaxID=1077442 RepID=A0A093Y5T2_TALMA
MCRRKQQNEKGVHCQGYSALRPAARRLLSVRPNASLLARSRSIATQSIAFSRPAVPSGVSSFQQFQRRWNSDEAAKIAAEKAETSVEEGAIEAAAMEAAKKQGSTVDATSAEQVSAEAQDSAAEEVDALTGQDFRSPRRVNGRVNNVDPSPTIYIGNLFFDITAEDLKSKMESFGVVEKAAIISDARGLSKGFGYVTFDSVEAAQRAIEEMNQQVYEGRRVLVQFSAAGPREKFRPKGQPTRSLYIGNLAYDLTDRELNELFKSVRNVIEVRVAVDRQTGNPRGFAHADFLDTPSAQAALEILSSKAPHGRRLKVDFSQNPKRTQRRNAESQDSDNSTDVSSNDAEAKP